MTDRIWPNWLPLRDDLSALSPYGAPQIDSVARMNTNENPYPPSRELMAAIGNRIDEVSGTLNRYPNRDARSLREGLANFLNELSGTQLTSENIWAANGSNEIIQSLFLAFGDGKALGFTPSYSMHPLIARVARTTWVEGMRNEDFSIDLPQALAQINKETPRLTFITTPNNPTGTSLSIDDIETLAVAVGKIGGLLVVDEAYAEFSSISSAVTLIKRFPHLVVIRTMSKAFAFAGARIGYLAADSQVVDAIQLVRLPYHLSALTQAVGLVALEHSAASLQTVEKIRKDREFISLAISELGAKVIPSDANFLLFSVEEPQKVWKELLEQGVLIRDVGLSGYLRVTVGTPEENQRFIDALAKCIGGEV